MNEPRIKYTETTGDLDKESARLEIEVDGEIFCDVDSEDGVVWFQSTNAQGVKISVEEMQEILKRIQSFLESERNFLNRPK